MLTNAQHSFSILRGYTAAESPLTGDYDWMAKPGVGIPIGSPAIAPCARFEESG